MNPVQGGGKYFFSFYDHAWKNVKMQFLAASLRFS